MPGVSVTTDTIATPGAPASVSFATLFVAGITERGPVDKPVLIQSMAEYVEKLGARVSYGALHDALTAFFGEGGGRAYVARVLGDNAVTATLTLVDRNGAPRNTLRIDAIEPGAWANGAAGGLKIEVANGTVANTFTITVTHNGQTVETFRNIRTPAEAVTKLASSKYVRATDLGSITAAPNNNPAVVAATSLATGADDRGGLAAADYIAAADDLFGKDLGVGAIAIPGQTAAAVAAGLIAHCQTNHRIALLAPASGQTVAEVKDTAAALLGTDGAEYAGLFYPWVKIPAGGSSTRTISPEGYVAGVRARANDAEGPWRAPAGAIAAARYIVDVESVMSSDDADDLDDANVSVIRVIGDAPRLYGWRSLSDDDDNWSMLTGRDVLNALVYEAEVALEEFVFETIDPKGSVFGRLAGVLTGIAEPMRAAGGLYAQSGDKGYRVDVGPSVNTQESIAAGQIRGLLGVRVSPTGTIVDVVISKAAFGAALS